jgi:hypothetical protein
MRVTINKISGSLFILTIICFFMPFISISCNNKEVVKLTGFQLVTGSELKQTELLGQESRRLPAQAWAFIPFGLAGAGVALGFWKGRLASGLRSVCGAISVVSLLVLRAKLHDNLLQYPKLVFYVEFLPCFWITLSLFSVAVVVNAAAGLASFRQQRQ